MPIAKMSHTPAFSIGLINEIAKILISNEIKAKATYIIFFNLFASNIILLLNCFLRFQASF